MKTPSIYRIHTLAAMAIAASLLSMTTARALEKFYDFTDGEGAQNWVLSNGGVAGEGGIDDGPALLLHFPERFAPAATAEMIYPPLGRDFEISFFYKQEDLRIRIQIGEFSIYYDSGWTFAKPLQEAGFRPAGNPAPLSGEWNKIQIVSKEGVMEMYLNDSLIVAGEDATAFLGESGNPMIISTWGAGAKDLLLDHFNVKSR